MAIEIVDLHIQHGDFLELFVHKITNVVQTLINKHGHH